MKGSEVKALRKMLGWNQKTMGRAIKRNADYVDYIEIADASLTSGEASMCNMLLTVLDQLISGPPIVRYDRSEFKQWWMFELHESARQAQILKRLAQQ